MGSEIGLARSRRLVHDFVTAPLPLETVLPRLDNEPSPIPTLVQAAAWWPDGDRPVAPLLASGEVVPELTTPRPRTRPSPADILVATTHDRGDGCSFRLSWPERLNRLPPFDGELVVLEAAPDHTWIGLEGAISLLMGAGRSEQEHREAQIAIRRFLTNLSYAVTTEDR